MVKYSNYKKKKKVYQTKLTAYLKAAIVNDAVELLKEKGGGIEYIPTAVKRAINRAEFKLDKWIAIDDEQHDKICNRVKQFVI